MPKSGSLTKEGEPVKVRAEENGTHLFFSKKLGGDGKERPPAKIREPRTESRTLDGDLSSSVVN